MHYGKVEKGPFKTGEAVELCVDARRRTAIRANHSATHLLHEALRQVLGPHVAQKGSMVAPDRLRFDFSHPKPLSVEELSRVEKLANEVILQNAAVETHLMDVDEAKDSGAMALFGEKYGDEVRVVSMGAPMPDSKKPWSIELCGGTHAFRTGDIGLVRIVGESASAAGVRRLEALTAHGAASYLAGQDERLRDLAGMLKTKPDKVVARVEALVDEKRALERQLAEARRQIAMGDASSGDGATGGDETVRSVGKGNVKLLARTVRGINPKDLRGLVDEGKKQISSGVVAIITVSDEGKAGLVVGVTDDLKASVSAVDLVKVGAAALGGSGGGGRPDMAQAGGPDGGKASVALDAIETQLATMA